MSTYIIRVVKLHKHHHSFINMLNQFSLTQNYYEKNITIHFGKL